jgi:hypothetical protein
LAIIFGQDWLRVVQALGVVEHVGDNGALCKSSPDGFNTGSMPGFIARTRFAIWMAAYLPSEAPSPLH